MLGDQININVYHPRNEIAAITVYLCTPHNDRNWRDKGLIMVIFTWRITLFDFQIYVSNKWESWLWI